MEIISQSISDVRTIRPSYFHDHRGYFVESYNKKKICGMWHQYRVRSGQSFLYGKKWDRKRPSLPSSSIRAVEVDFRRGRFRF